MRQLHGYYNGSWTVRNVRIPNLPSTPIAKPTPKPKSKPVKLSSYKANEPELFSNVGVEPTFYPEIILNSKLLAISVETLLDNLWSNLVSACTYNKLLKNLHPWLKTAQYDDCNLEVPSPHHYKTLDRINRDYTKLSKELNDIGFKPSSVIDRSVEGGCHINFNLADKYEKSKEHTTQFCKNLVCFLNSNPSLVWAFLAPEDNNSSHIYKSLLMGNLRKGDFLTIRKKDNWMLREEDKDIKYIELRFFMMPRTVEEFSFHIQAADKILKFVWNQTIAKKPTYKFELKNTNSEHLKSYTYKKAMAELESVLPQLGITCADMVRFNKFTMLKERFSFGKKYLV